MDVQFSASRNLGQQMRSLRSAYGVSQQELARRTRISQPRISQIESGRSSGPLPLRTLCDLADGLGVDVEALIASDPIYGSLDLNTLRFQAPFRARLPRPTDTFVGRANDLSMVVELVRSGVPLLTLIGPGGVGKTQLAIHACRELADAFPRRMLMFFVSLAACVDMSCIVTTIARGIGLDERDARPLRNRLLSDLPSGRVLLILDNTEQAASPVAELSAELLAAYPGLSIMVTSRAPLSIRDEHQYEVLPLGLHDDAATASALTAEAVAAVELFVRRAQEAVPAFALTDANAPQVAAICERLDGLPLGIELAATRVMLYSPGQLLRRLDRRLAFVKAGSRDLPSRQQSLRANIEWSFELLDSELQALLRRLAVFVGGFMLDAAIDVAGANVRLTEAENRPELPVERSGAAITESVSMLLDQHLLTRTEDARGVLRFGMLETIREYAREQLDIAGEAVELGERHLSWALTLAERSVPIMFTADEPAWLERLLREDENLQAALGWAFGSGRESDLEQGARLAAALADYWYVSGGLSEGLEWLTRGIDLTDDQLPSIGRARLLVSACQLEQTQGVIESAQAHGEIGLELAKSLNDQPTIGRGLLLLGNLAMMRGHLDEARELHKEALVHFRRLDDRAWTALALLNLGMDFYRQTHLDLATLYAGAALTIARAIGNRWDIIPTLRLLAEVARDRGDQEKATALFTESLQLAWQHGSEREAADSLSGIGTVAAAAGDLERAARLLGAAETLYQRFHIEMPPPLRPDWAAVVSRIQAGLTDDQFRQSWTSGSPAQVIVEIIGESYRQS